MNRTKILNILNEMDIEASFSLKDSKKYFAVIVGGNGLILHGVVDRATDDIDILNASSEIKYLFHRFGANMNVSAYAHNFPLNYEDRLLLVSVGGRKIDFFIASLEDIVIAKLYSSRDKDLHDISSYAVLQKLDWDLLDHFATDENEAKANALNKYRYNEFLDLLMFKTKFNKVDN